MRRAAVAAACALAAALAGCADADRRTLRVGPDRALKTPSAAAAILRDGDVVEIDAGEYVDCASWRADGIVIRGVGGRAHVRDATCEDRGIWVVRGGATTIENVEFSGAHASPNNGAGIRFHGARLTVRGAWFHDNENGILTGHEPASEVTIEDSVFERNGRCEPFCAHGVYAGAIARLVVRNSTFREQRIAHHVKSRALHTEVTGCRIEDGPDGTASYSINLPNGGSAVIRGNVIQQGPKSDNPSVMISIGEEGPRRTGDGYLIEGNAFRNDHAEPTSFVRNVSPLPARLRANAYVGPGDPLLGIGTVEE